MSENADTVTRLTDAFMSGDREAVLGMFHPEIEINEAASLPWGGVHRGLDGFNKLHEIMDPLWTEQVIDLEVFEAGDVVVLHERLEITGNATGQSMELQVVDLFRFREGKVSSIDVYYKDVKAVLDVLGR